MLGLALILGKIYKNCKISCLRETALSLYAFEEGYYGLLLSLRYTFSELKRRSNYTMHMDYLLLRPWIDHIYSFLRLRPASACSNDKKNSFSTL
jgi:hypothetical protein